MQELMSYLFANQSSCSPVTVHQSPSTIYKHSVPRVLTLLSTKLHARLILGTLRISTDSLAVKTSITARKTTLFSIHYRQSADTMGHLPQT